MVRSFNIFRDTLFGIGLVFKKPFKMIYVFIHKIGLHKESFREWYDPLFTFSVTYCVSCIPLIAVILSGSQVSCAFICTPQCSSLHLTAIKPIKGIPTESYHSSVCSYPSAPTRGQHYPQTTLSTHFIKMRQEMHCSQQMPSQSFHYRCVYVLVLF